MLLARNDGLDMKCSNLQDTWEPKLWCGDLLWRGYSLLMQRWTRLVINNSQGRTALAQWPRKKCDQGECTEDRMQIVVLLV
jgi:hypothetical protein